MNSTQLCIYCKGSRNLCGLGRCPLLDKVKLDKKMTKIKDNFFGAAPSVFVGRIGYPNVFVGPLGNIGKTDLSDNPSSWFKKPYEDIIEKRSMVLRSKYKQNVFSKSRFVEDNKLLALAKRPTDIELLFKGKPTYRMNFSDMVRPVGPSVSVKKLTLAENVKVSRNVEKVVNDELKTNEATMILYKKNVDVYKLTNIISSGSMGLDKNKKMVPTRWSITAIDDIVCKNILGEIRNFPSINEYRVYESQFLNNKFVILMMPGNWEFENFEAWKPGSFWSFNLKKTEVVEEYEPFKGRKKYADKQTGGYYAARLGVAEKLLKEKRQARVIGFREVYEGYVVPVGVWQVRENVRNAMKSGYQKFSTLKESLEYIRGRLKIPLENYKEKSKMLKQRRLGDFIN